MWKGIDDQHRPSVLTTEACGSFAASSEWWVSSNEDESDVCFFDVHLGALEIVLAASLNEPVVIRDRAVFCKSVFGTPTTVIEVEFNGCIKTTTVCAGLSA